MRNLFEKSYFKDILYCIGDGTCVVLKKYIIDMHVLLFINWYNLHSFILSMKWNQNSLFSHHFISHQPTSRNSSFMLNHFKAIFIENTFCCWNVECVRSAYNNTYNSCLHFYVNIIFLFFQTTQNIYFLNGENVEYINAWWAEARNIYVYIFARKSISR